MQRREYLDRLVDVFVGVAEAILVLRVLFRLFDANGSSGFVQWIYQTSDVLMAPFRGIFPTQVVGRGYVLDMSALFAILVYAVAGYVIMALLDLLPARRPVKVVKR